MIAALALQLALASGDRFFAPDKALHFSASAGIAGAAYAGAALLHQDVEVRLTAAVGLALFAGVAKELADVRGFGDPSSLDLAWDVIGSVAGATLSWLVDRLITQLRHAAPRAPGPSGPALSGPGSS